MLARQKASPRRLRRPGLYPRSLQPIREEGSVTISAQPSDSSTTPRRTPTQDVLEHYKMLAETSPATLHLRIRFALSILQELPESGLRRSIELALAGSMDQLISESCEY